MGGADDGGPGGGEFPHNCLDPAGVWHRHLRHGSSRRWGSRPQETRPVRPAQHSVSTGLGSFAVIPALVESSRGFEGLVDTRGRRAGRADGLPGCIPAGCRGFGACAADRVRGPASAHGRPRPARLRTGRLAHSAFQRCAIRVWFDDDRRSHARGHHGVAGADHRPLSVFQPDSDRKGAARDGDQSERRAPDGHFAKPGRAADFLPRRVDRRAVGTPRRALDDDLL